MVVTVDNPKGPQHTGGAVAGPIFARTAKRVLEHLNVAPDHPEELAAEKPKRQTAAAPQKAPAPPRTAPVETRRTQTRPAANAAPVRTVKRPTASARTNKRPAAPNAHRASTTKNRRYNGGKTPSHLPRMTEDWGEQKWP